MQDGQHTVSEDRWSYVREENGLDDEDGWTNPPQPSPAELQALARQIALDEARERVVFAEWSRDLYGPNSDSGVCQMCNYHRCGTCSRNPANFAS